ncbi:MAG TPA: NF038122 family metalloprotease, partial [Phycisphaerae bacterium]|nr:NF038122 family metalloprotease [Phycisphaerae bacterium]
MVALAQTGNVDRAMPSAEQQEVAFYREGVGPVLIKPVATQTSVLYADGSEIDLEGEVVYRYVCGSDVSNLTVDDLRQVVQQMEEAFPIEGLPEPVNAGGLRGGPDVIFSVSGGLPTGAQGALDAAEAFLEAQFSDPVTVTINFSMASMGAGVLGGTSSFYAASVPWSTVRSGMIADMDGNDSIQSWLPSGSTIPVRYDASSSTVTNENRVFFTRANYNAAIGTVTGSAATMQLNTDFSWDYNPANGIAGGTYCFTSVLIHEVGHALGFTSGVDFRTADIEALDIFRFQRTDGTGDYNPDTEAEFETTARTADFNNLNDDANSDVISVEYRMSDGSPYQASHFREQSFPNIGIMDPAISANSTFYPDYFKTADEDMFDAIGWDFPAVVDTTAPNPDPMTFNVSPHATTNGIEMEASVATDGETPPVQYQFSCDSGGTGCDSSLWKSGVTYEDTGLLPNTQYFYSVKARDNFDPPNETAYSASQSAYTYAAIPGAPTLGGETTSSMDITVNPNGNPSYTEFVIYCLSSPDA